MDGLLNEPTSYRPMGIRVDKMKTQNDHKNMLNNYSQMPNNHKEAQNDQKGTQNTNYKDTKLSKGPIVS